MNSPLYRFAIRTYPLILFRYFLITLLVTAFSLINVVYAYPSPPSQIRFQLELSKPTASTIAGGETHTYEAELKAGQFARCVISQGEADLYVSVLSPKGELIFLAGEIETPPAPIEIMIAASMSGTYRLVVRPQFDGVAVKPFQVELVELRGRRESDGLPIQAAYCLEKGARLRLQKDSLKEALELLEQAAVLCRKVGKPREAFLAQLWLDELLRSNGEFDKAITPLKRGALD